jgi:hypothetical protein
LAKRLSRALCCNLGQKISQLKICSKIMITALVMMSMPKEKISN